MDLYKSDLINHIMSRLEIQIVENHEIFSGLQNLPKCLKCEILHQKVLAKIEKIFQGIHYEIIFKDKINRYLGHDTHELPPQSFRSQIEDDLIENNSEDANLIE